jgi:cytoskeletal protein RodZ
MGSLTSVTRSGVLEFMRKRRKAAALHLEEIQAQQLTELGTLLQQHRQSQGKSLEQIAAITKIQRRLLSAIEAGDIKALPEPVYIRALLRCFAEALSLEAEEFAAQFPLEITAQHQRLRQKNITIGQLRPIHLYILYIFVIVSAVNGLSVLISRSPSQNPPPTNLLGLSESLEPAASNKTAPNSQPLPVQASGPIREAFPLTGSSSYDSLIASVQQLGNSSPENPQKSTKPVQVKLTLVNQSWLRVIVDGKTAFEGMMLEGSQRTWLAEQAITVRAGNAGGVLVTFNNDPPKKLGEPGSVEEVTYQINAMIPSF